MAQLDISSDMMMMMMMMSLDLCIRLPQMIGYVNYFDNVKKMSLDVSDNKLNYKKIWEKVGSLMKTEFDSEPVMVINA